MISIWDFLFPRKCPVCDGILPYGPDRICRECDGSLMRIHEPFCRKCGKQLENETQEYCNDCGRKNHEYVRGRALFEYPNVRGSIYRFKYGGRKEYGEFFAEALAKELGEEIRSWRPDLITAVPLHPSRERARGYNQAAILAQGLGRRLSIPVDIKLIKRVKKTVPQKKLDPVKRQNNLKKAFKICRNDVKLSTIIIVDDIYTTGSTIDAVSRALKEKGAGEVYFVSLAIGKGL